MMGLLWTPSVDWMLEVLLVSITAFALAWTWTKALGLMWAVGADRERILAFTNAPIRFALALWVWSVVVGLGPRPELQGNPQLGFHTTIYGSDWLRDALLPAFFTILATVWGFKNLRDMAGGLALSLTRPFRIGDEVATATAHGRVSSIGLTRVRMRTEHGALIDVPASELASKTLRIAPRQGGALPVEIEVEISAARSVDRNVEMLRDHALLSAYSDSGVAVVVELLSQRRARIVATPTHPDDADELRSDLASRAASMCLGKGMGATAAAVPPSLTVPSAKPHRDDILPL